MGSGWVPEKGTHTHVLRHQEKPTEISYAQTQTHTERRSETERLPRFMVAVWHSKMTTKLKCRKFRWHGSYYMAVVPTVKLDWHMTLIFYAFFCSFEEMGRLFFGTHFIQCIFTALLTYTALFSFISNRNKKICHLNVHWTFEPNTVFNRCCCNFVLNAKWMCIEL